MHPSITASVHQSIDQSTNRSQSIDFCILHFICICIFAFPQLSVVSTTLRAAMWGRGPLLAVTLPPTLGSMQQQRHEYAHNVQTYSSRMKIQYRNAEASNLSTECCRNCSYSPYETLTLRGYLRCNEEHIPNEF